MKKKTKAQAAIITPLEILAELLKQSGSPASKPDFFKNKQHDEHLCPAFKQKVGLILDVYQSRYTDVQDVQGFNDEGVDVYMTYEDRSGTYSAGLQIKSYRELDEWLRVAKPKKSNTKKTAKIKPLEKKVSLIKTLKAQMYDALYHAEVTDAYIVLCGETQVHKKGLRRIAAAFKKKKGKNITVILPEQAMLFYEMSDDEIRAFVDTKIYQNSYVFRKALEEIVEDAHYEIAELSEEDRIDIITRCNLIYYALRGHVHFHDLLDIVLKTADLIKEVQNAGFIIVDSDDIDRTDLKPAIAESLGRIVASSLFTEYADEGYFIHPEAYPAFCSMFFEQVVRYGQDDAEWNTIQVVADALPQLRSIPE